MVDNRYNHRVLTPIERNRVLKEPTGAVPGLGKFVKAVSDDVVPDFNLGPCELARKGDCRAGGGPHEFPRNKLDNFQRRGTRAKAAEEGPKGVVGAGFVLPPDGGTVALELRQGKFLREVGEDMHGVHSMLALGVFSGQIRVVCNVAVVHADHTEAGGPGAGERVGIGGANRAHTCSPGMDTLGPRELEILEIFKNALGILVDIATVGYSPGVDSSLGHCHSEDWLHSEGDIGASAEAVKTTDMDTLPFLRVGDNYARAAARRVTRVFFTGTCLRAMGDGAAAVAGAGCSSSLGFDQSQILIG